ncbi:hypothetical protein ACFQAT_13065 [Undibacterium arcticum]|uniref:Uncharacterized protein n=1 Tax=Undibacterium arcticum TaxID=1762892 RepID=A0ABV7FAP3_9BURK
MHENTALRQLNNVFLPIFAQKYSGQVRAKGNNRVHFGFVICARNFGEKE